MGGIQQTETRLLQTPFPTAVSGGFAAIDAKKDMSPLGLHLGFRWDCDEIRAARFMANAILA